MKNILKRNGYYWLGVLGLILYFNAHSNSERLYDAGLWWVYCLLILPLFAWFYWTAQKIYPRKDDYR